MFILIGCISSAGLLISKAGMSSISMSYQQSGSRAGLVASECISGSASCSVQVLEGYVYLGNVSSLGEEVMAAFAAVTGAAALKVVRGVVLMRPTPGLEERVKSTQLLQELVKWLPPDLFRTCLSRVHTVGIALQCLLDWFDV